jgi:antitoxin VapB
MTTTLFMNGRSQSVRLPKNMRLPGKEVSIRRVGMGVMIEPVSATTWPANYFDIIRISDKKFKRPKQGTTPPSPDMHA